MTIAASREGDAYLSVYQVLDEVCFARGIPVGSQGSLFAAIDGLRKAAAPSEHIVLAEQIAVAIHKLVWALRNGGNGEEAAREELQALGASWLRIPVPSTVH